MTQELYQQIQELILMAIALIAVITLLTLLLHFVLKHYDDSIKDKETKKLNRRIKDLEERLETKTEIERMRYEHETLINDFKNKNKK